MWIQVSGEREGWMRACHDPLSPTEEFGVAGDPGGRLCVPVQGPGQLRSEEGRKDGHARAHACARVKLAGPGDMGLTLCSWKRLVKSAFAGLEHSSERISFSEEKDQETKMRLFGFQVNHVTCLYLYQKYKFYMIAKK